MKTNQKTKAKMVRKVIWTWDMKNPQEGHKRVSKNLCPEKDFCLEDYIDEFIKQIGRFVTQHVIKRTKTKVIIQREQKIQQLDTDMHVKAIFLFELL